MSNSCATSLVEARIRFEKGDKNLFDISFKNRTLKIPPLSVDGRTESVLQNLMVYELYDERRPRCVSDYVKFMGCLINTTKDVETLCRAGIVENRKGSKKRVSTMFNNMNNSIVARSKSHFCYAKMFEQINKHCLKRRTDGWPP